MPYHKKKHTKAREYLDYWIENSIHAVEQFRPARASQEADELLRRPIEAVKDKGITEKAMPDQVGDLTNYLRGKLANANQVERDRRTK